MPLHPGKIGIWSGLGIGLLVGLLIDSRAAHAQGSGTPSADPTQPAWAIPVGPSAPFKPTGLTTGPFMDPGIPAGMSAVQSSAWDAFRPAPLLQDLYEVAHEEVYLRGWLPAPVLTAADANKLYGIEERLKFNGPTPLPVAQMQSEAMHDRVWRDVIAAQEPGGIWNRAAQAGVGLLAGLLDPVSFVIYASVGYFSRTWISTAATGVLASILLAVLIAVAGLNTPIEVFMFGVACMVGALATRGVLRAFASNFSLDGAVPSYTPERQAAEPAKSAGIDGTNEGGRPMDRPRLFANRPFWLRIGLVVSVVWVAGTILASLGNQRSFAWFTPYGFGPAGLWAIVGVAVIIVVCLGVPWIAAAIDGESDKQGRP